MRRSVGWTSRLRVITSWGCVECDGRNPDGTRFCGCCGAPRAGAAAATATRGHLLSQGLTGVRPDNYRWVVMAVPHVRRITVDPDAVRLFEVPAEVARVVSVLGSNTVAELLG